MAAKLSVFITSKELNNKGPSLTHAVFIKPKQNNNKGPSLMHLVEADVDWANISGADGCHREKAVFPVTDVDGSLVEAEQALEPASNAWIDTEQFTCHT